MAEITTVTEGQAASFQQMYEQIFEAWLRQSLLDKTKEKDAQKKSDLKEEKIEDQEIDKSDEFLSGIKITDGDKVLYERKNNQTYINEITPELIGKLGVMKETAIGEKVVGAESKTLEVDGKILLKSDPQGKILVNELKLESELSQKSSSLENTLSVLEQMEDSPVKHLLRDTLSEIKSLQSENSQLKDKYQDLINLRETEPRSTTWWSQAGNKVKDILQSFQDEKDNIQKAQTIRELFNRGTEMGDKTYQAEEYMISREGNNYTLQDKNGEKLMEFQSYSMGQIKIEGEVKLNENQKQEISQLKLQLERGENNLENFAPVGTKEAKNLGRINNILHTLTEYANSQGQKVQIKGQSYSWVATPDGQAKIEANDERGTLLIKTKGQVMTRMNERDLIHFEQALDVIKQQIDLGKVTKENVNLTRNITKEKSQIEL
jgi:hypothetical protein